MAGKPWEKYQAQPTESASTGKPWEKFGGAVTEPEKIIQEQHPSISFGTRALLQNLANDEGKISELKKLGLEVGTQENGEIKVRAPGETDWKVLDPNTPFFSMDSIKDLPGDLTDIGSDIGDGIASSAGTVAGALGGTAVAPGVGTVVGGSLGGGASSAAYEATRQKLGQLAGIDQEVNPMDVGISGFSGAASPLLFGNSMGVKQGAKAALAGESARASLRNAIGLSAREKLTQQAAENLAKAGERGLAQWGWQGVKKVAPSIGGALSGKGKESVKALYNNFDYVKDFTNEGQIVDKAKELAPKFADELGDKVNQAGINLADEIDSIGKPLRLDTVKAPMRNASSEIIDNGSAASKAQIELLQDAYNRIFENTNKTPKVNPLTLAYEVPSKEIADETTGRGLWQIQRQLKTPMNITNRDGILKNGVVADEMSALNRAAGKSYANANQVFKDASDGLVGKNKDEYAKMIGIEDMLHPDLGDSKKLLSTMRNMDKPSKITTRVGLQRAKKAGVNSADEMGKFQSAVEWFNPVLGWKERSGGAVIGTGLGYLAGAQSGVGQGGAGVGAVAGGATGAFLGGPRAIKYMTKKAIQSGQAKDYAEQVAEKALKSNQGKKLFLLNSTGAADSVGESLWEKMMTEKENK